jgi:hypothetical protein
MDDATRHAVLQLLGQVMSDVSEECWYAGWVDDAEYHIPELCRRVIDSGRPQLWGHGTLTVETARGLTYLAEQLGCWANWNNAEAVYIPHQPFPLPAGALADFERRR